MRLNRGALSDGASPQWAGERVTMGRHFLRDLEGLWAGLLKLAAVVEDALNRSVRALCDGRADLADEVKGEERAVDRWEVQIERECLRSWRCTSRWPPTCGGWPSVLKINGDLERMGDLARNIAKRVKKLARRPPGRSRSRSSSRSMALETLEQVRDSLDALTKSDARARPRRHRRRPPHRPPLPRRPERAQGGDPPRPRPAQHLAPPDQHRPQPRADRRPRHQHRRGRRLPQGRRHRPPRLQHRM